jgi:hypothetical protein
LEGILLSDHPTLEDLQAFWRGGLAPEGVRAVVRHLLHGCQRCGSLLAPQVEAMFGGPPGREEGGKAETTYDDVLDRVFVTLSRRDSGAKGRIGWIRDTLAKPPVCATADRGDLPCGPAGFEDLLDRCQALRYDDPGRMIEIARSAAAEADRFARHQGRERAADLRCRALTELANACRVADRLREAQDALDSAAESYLEGTMHELVGARLLEIQASVAADRRRFGEALQSLDVVCAVRLRRGDRHLAGRALVKKGLYTEYAGDAEAAVPILQEGLALVDRDRDPYLVFGAIHNLARALLGCGRAAEARELLQLSRFGDSGRVSRLRVRWLEADIDAASGNLDQSAAVLEEVLCGFEELRLTYNAALAGLDLAAIHLRQGRIDDARTRALAAVEVFLGVGVDREAMAGLVVLREAFERGIATATLLQGVQVLIKRMAALERDPA